MPTPKRRVIRAPEQTPQTTQQKPAQSTQVARRTPTPTKGTKAAQTAPKAPANDLGHAATRFQWEYVAIDQIEPYPFNPRDNEKAIPAVMESIRNFGFLIPVVLDSNNVLVAGHTRVEASKRLGLEDVPSVRADHLTQEQINAFRLIDNKVAEAAMWDTDLLAGEIGKLKDLGLDFTQFGWKQEEIDCLSEVVADTCLTESVTISEEETAAVRERRAPATARYVLGEFVMFTTRDQYNTWAEGLRNLHGFNEEAIQLELKRRLGLPVN